MTRVFFPNLDGLRFLAFFVVFVRHSLGDAMKEVDVGWFNVIKDGLFDAGDVGVGFFFVLSGFLITYLILQEIMSHGRIHVGAFYLRRSLRIWPLYYAVVLVGIVGYSALTARFDPAADADLPLWPYLTFLGNFETLLGYAPPLFLGITWSVAIEEQFYIVWPQLFRWVPRRGYIFIFIAAIFGCLVFRAIYRNRPWFLNIHSFAVMSDLAVGGLAAYLALNRKGFVACLSSLSRASIIACYCLAVVIVLFRNHVYYLQSDQRWILQLGSLFVIVRRPLLACCFAFVIIEQNWCEHSFLKISRLPALSTLGKYSYGLYLLHPLALILAAFLLGFEAAHAGSLARAAAFGCLGFVLTLGLSVASYHLFEMPFLRLKLRFAYVPSGSP